MLRHEDSIGACCNAHRGYGLIGDLHMALDKFNVVYSVYVGRYLGGLRLEGWGYLDLGGFFEATMERPYLYKY